MTLRAFVVTTSLVAIAAGAARAQEPRTAPTAQTASAPGQRGRTPEAPRAATPAPAPAAAPAAPAPSRREAQPVNIKVDLTLTDQRGGAEPIKRTVTVLAADGYTGSIRTSSQVFGINFPVPLNVDASPTLLADGKIRLAVSLQYDWPAPTDGNFTRGAVTSSSVHDQLMMILENGKATIVAQSADPVGDRQVTIEVKATTLR